MAYIDNGIIWAKCPRCRWRAEADASRTQRAEMFHWDDEHDDTRRI